jgi:hypothetical protein
LVSDPEQFMPAGKSQRFAGCHRISHHRIVPLTNGFQPLFLAANRTILDKIIGPWLVEKEKSQRKAKMRRFLVGFNLASSHLRPRRFPAFR